MEFNNIENEQRPAIAVWGTKRGKQTFFTDKLVDKAEVDQYLTDVRTPIQFTSTKLDFYSFEQTAQYQCFTAYRTILDWVNRPGYYAVSLLLPTGYKLSDNPLSVLDAMRDTYWEKYIEQTSVGCGIKKETSEAAYFFIEEVKQAKLTLKRGGNTALGSQKIIFRYSNQDTLKDFFEKYAHPKFHSYQTIYLLPESSSLTSSLDALVGIDLNNLGKVYEVTIHVHDENSEQKQLTGATIKVLKNDAVILEKVFEQPIVFQLEMSEEDDIRYIASKKNYEPFNSIRKDQFERAHYEKKEKEGTVYLAIPLVMTPEAKESIRTQRQAPKKSEKPVEQTQKGTSKTRHKQGRKTQQKHHTSKGKNIKIHEGREIDLSYRGQDNKNERKRRNKVKNQSNFLKKYRKLIGLILLLVVIIAVVFRFSGGRHTNAVKDWKTKTEEIKKLAEPITKANWQWNNDQYTKFVKTFDKQKNTIDSLQKVGIIVKNMIDLDSLKNGIVDPKAKMALDTAISKHLKSDRFDYVKTKKFITDATTFRLSTSKLEQYKSISIHCLFANQLIRKGYKKEEISIPGQERSYTPETIQSNFNTLLYKSRPGNEYGFLSETQRNILNIYQDILIAYNYKRHKSTEELKAYVLVRKELGTEARKRWRQISEFLKNRGIE
ncbi:MAG TPA: hypothetical protein DCS93_07120 [Microscillaceae bacterium]|nr:hypothetical protein [Microscillaceae bacterium]